MTSSPALERIRQTVRRIEGDRRDGQGVLRLGLAAIDGQLAEGGLRRDALHEVSARHNRWADDGAATLFMAGIAAAALKAAAGGNSGGGYDGHVLWVLRSRDLFAPGLYQAGLDPARIIYAEAHSDTELLAVMEEGLRHRGLAAVVGEAKSASMTATRRLHLAAEGGPAIALLLRRPARANADPLDMPSAAFSRWRVGAAPSLKAPWGGLGPACWELECMRQRGGNPFTLTVEAPDETGRIALPAQLVDRPVAAGTAADARSAA